jgi:[FeFe] hydrogenase H-cluster maturation GTPase HydF
MSLQKTPSSNRLHIAIFGKRNMGKSSLINAVTGQNLAIVSEYAGTTTDPVYKAMEILPIGPVTLIDTAGIDDEGNLGKLRVEKTLNIIRKTDIALIVTDFQGLSSFDNSVIELLDKSKIPFIIVINKVDLSPDTKNTITDLKNKKYNYLEVSAKNNFNIDKLKEMIIKYSPKEFEQPGILTDLIEPGDHIVLVIPVDTGMPKGRLILPQVQVMRDILDNNAVFSACKVEELHSLLAGCVKKPKLVITDSQVFEEVSAIVPEDINLTSFSILFARYKGDLPKLIEGVKALKKLKDNDKVLIAEACTHHQQCDDIGTVKIPRWIRQHINENIHFDFCNGRDYPDNLKEYKAVIHCGGCMINRKEMLSRIDISYEQGVPIVNYGLTIAFVNGILDRAVKPFKEAFDIWNS